MDRQQPAAEAQDAIPEGYVPCTTWDGPFGPSLGRLYQRRDGGGFAFRVQARHNNARDVTHGGMLMTLADQILGLSVQQALEGGYAATVSLNCDFIASAAPGDLIEGTAEVTRVTRSIVFVRGSLRCGDRLLLNASGLWKRLARRDPPRPGA